MLGIKETRLTFLFLVSSGFILLKILHKKRKKTNHGSEVVYNSFLILFCLFCLETEFLCIPLAVLELTL